MPSVEVLALRLDDTGSPVLLVFCDCASTTQITVDEVNINNENDVKEFAYTCENCMTVHWLTIEKILVEDDD